MKTSTPITTSATELKELAAEHPTLAGGITFVANARDWGSDELSVWFDEYLVQPGLMPRPSVVSDPAIGTAPLRAGVKVTATRPVALQSVSSIATRARARVVDALRAFIGAPSDDRFLQAAIFAERVQRVRQGSSAVWVPSPREIDALSNIALSLFAADLLTHREFYEQRLCVCEVCGTVSFQPQITSRRGCMRHQPRTESTSGFQVSATPPEGEFSDS